MVYLKVIGTINMDLIWPPEALNWRTVFFSSGLWFDGDDFCEFDDYGESADSYESVGSGDSGEYDDYCESGDLS